VGWGPLALVRGAVGNGSSSCDLESQGVGAPRAGAWRSGKRIVELRPRVPGGGEIFCAGAWRSGKRIVELRPRVPGGDFFARSPFSFKSEIILGAGLNEIVLSAARFPSPYIK
jgi:hypothetical protein